MSVSVLDPVRVRIVQAARQQFFAHGFSKVTTDELAAGLGISKKTLYKHFSTKEALLREAIDLFKGEMVSELSRFVEDRELDFLDKLHGLLMAIGMKVSTIGRPFLEDMRKRAPDVWRELEQFRRERILTFFGRLFEEGSRKGVLRPDVSPQLLMVMWLGVIQHVFNPETLSQLPFSAAQAFEAFTKVMFEGVLTDEARDRYRAAP